ncbi:MAG: hypothetical protein A2V67_02790 [Deltaproteobacteria bacterium RBG_13_61_14]|nr:MAG: hypothetical protein A2V67_02790 [Deltaproteobacteria bacterium RBG_13_61_14]
MRSAEHGQRSPGKILQIDQEPSGSRPSAGVYRNPQEINPGYGLGDQVGRAEMRFEIQGINQRYLLAMLFKDGGEKVESLLGTDPSLLLNNFPPGVGLGKRGRC